MQDHGPHLREGAAAAVREVLDRREVAIVFQPLYGFSEGAIIGHEALCRGPAGSPVESPDELFRAARDAGLAAPLGVLCLLEALRAFARDDPGGLLFLNVSPLLIQHPGFQQDRGRRFLESLGLAADRLVIELTEDYPTADYRLVRESLLAYRALGLRVAIDDLGEGFASLRLWSELRPAFVKADRHFVSGIAGDAVKLQFLRAIRQIADTCGSKVVAEGLEDPADFRVARQIGIDIAQGWLIGRPAAAPLRAVLPGLAIARADRRPAALPVARYSHPAVAGDFLRAVEVAAPLEPYGALLDRFKRDATLLAIPVSGTEGIAGLVPRPVPVTAAAAMALRPCREFMRSPVLRAEADLPLPALGALLGEADGARLSEGFVITAQGRYLGMGQAADVIRILTRSNDVAMRHTHPLTGLPGPVPLSEHLDRLLDGACPFWIWFLEISELRGLNDCVGYAAGDDLIRRTAGAIDAACVPGIDFAAHLSGSRFVAALQGPDAPVRARSLAATFGRLRDERVGEEARARGYYRWTGRDGIEQVRALPRIAIGVLPVLPGALCSRQEVLDLAKRACETARSRGGLSVHVDERQGNAYPRSVLLADD